MMRRLLLTLVSALLLASAAPGRAKEKPANRAAALILLEDARALAKQGHHEAACKKLALAQRLDPSVDTLLKLADCYERTGQTASAWHRLLEAEVAAQEPGQRYRLREVRSRMDRLRPKLSRLSIDVPQPVDGLQVSRSGTTVPEEDWGELILVDPGTHEIVARAPGHSPWRREVEVGPDADEVRVSIPPFEDDEGNGPDAKPPPPDTAAEPVGANGQWIAGWVVGAVGLVGLGVGTALRVVALDKDEESVDHCLPDNDLLCSDEGIALREEAHDFQTASTVVWVVGGAALATGIVLLLTAPSDDDDEDAKLELSPTIAPGRAGLRLRCTW